MKKKFTLFVCVLLLIPQIALANAGTLSQYYGERDQKLPSLATRAYLYGNIASDRYIGSYSQNLALLAYLQGEPLGGEMLGGNIPISATDWSLASPHSSSATTIDLADFDDLRGNAVATTSMPTKVYLVVEPENSDNTEIVMCLAANGNETTTLFTGCTRGLAFYGTSEAAVTANQKSHPSGAGVIMTNVGQFYNNFMDIDSAQTIAGIKTFSSYPKISSYAAPTSDEQFAPKKYVDDVALVSAPDANETTKGVSELATGAEAAAGTSSGSAARLVLPASLATTTSQVATTSVPVTGTNGKLSDNFTDFSLNKTWTGTNSFATTTTATSTVTSETVASSSITQLNLNGVNINSEILGTNTTLYHRHPMDFGTESTSTPSNGVLNITHTLGATPSMIEIYATTDCFNDATARIDSYGVATSTVNQRSVFTGTIDNTAYAAGSGNYIIRLNYTDGGTDRSILGSLVTLNSTTIGINLIVADTPHGDTLYILWKAWR